MGFELEGAGLLDAHVRAAGVGRAKAIAREKQRAQRAALAATAGSVADSLGCDDQDDDPGGGLSSSSLGEAAASAAKHVLAALNERPVKLLKVLAKAGAGGLTKPQLFAACKEALVVVSTASGGRDLDRYSRQPPDLPFAFLLPPPLPEARSLCTVPLSGIYCRVSHRKRSRAKPHLPYVIHVAT